MTNYFSGINFNITDNLNTEAEEKNYLDGWICAPLIFRNCLLTKFDEEKQILCFCDYLKI